MFSSVLFKDFTYLHFQVDALVLILNKTNWENLIPMSYAKRGR